MAKSRKRRTSVERQEAPEGRDTPTIGPRQSPRKVGPLDAEPAIARPPEGEHMPHDPDDDPYQDPGGGEPANG